MIENYAYSDLGLFIGMTTVPIHLHTKKFYKKELDSLVKRYRKNLCENIGCDGNADFACYNPKGYYIFGKFDIAFITLIDDFEVCGRTFRPYNYTIRQDNNESNPRLNLNAFDHKILAGKFIERARTTENEAPIIANARDTFLRKNKRFPFFCICEVKLNNILLMQNGYDPLHRAFREYFFNGAEGGNIYTFSDDSTGVESKVLLIETFGTSEFILLIFSNSIYRITDVVMELRSLHFSDNEIKPRGSAENILVEQTNSTYGVDYDLFLENLKSCSKQLSKSGLDDFSFKVNKTPRGWKYLNPSNDEEIAISTRWFVPPKTIYNSATSNGQDDVQNILVGLGDLILKSKEQLPVIEALGNLINEYANMVESCRPEHFLTEARSYPVVMKSMTKLKERFHSENGTDSSDNSNGVFKRSCSNWLLNSTEISEIENSLREAGVAKIVRNKIAKIISNYNTVVSNPILFLSFLDITNFLKNDLRVTLKHWGFKDLPTHVKNEFLKNKFLYYEKAFNNRFFQSTFTKELTDFNSEYFGSMHQIMSAFTFAYKSFSKLFTGADKNSDYVVVGSTPVIQSTKSFIRIGYFHLLQSEGFAAICCHETMNYFYDKLNKQSLKQYDVFSKKEQDNGSTDRLNELFEKAGFTDEPFSSVMDYNKVGCPLLNKFKERLSKKYETIKENESKNSTAESDKRWANDYLLNKHLLDEFFDDTLVLKYFVKDILTLYLSYLGDKHLFELWHCQYFLQLPMNYQSDRMIRDDKFCIFLLRMMFVLSDVQDEDGAPIINNYYLNRESLPSFIAPNKILQHQWFTYFGKIRWIVEEMLYDPGIRELKYAIENWAKQLFLYGNSDYLREEEYSKDDSVKEYEDMVSEIGGKTQSIIDKLKKGELVLKDTSESRFRFAVEMIYAFLKHYQEDYWSNMSQEKLLMRDDKGRAQTKNSKSKFNGNYAKMLVDRQGGFFCIDARTRREIFRMRVTFVKSLWNESLLVKRDEFLIPT